MTAAVLTVIFSTKWNSSWRTLNQLCAIQNNIIMELNFPTGSRNVKCAYLAPVIEHWRISIRPLGQRLSPPPHFPFKIKTTSRLSERVKLQCPVERSRVRRGGGVNFLSSISSSDDGLHVRSISRNNII